MAIVTAADGQGLIQPAWMMEAIVGHLMRPFVDRIEIRIVRHGGSRSVHWMPRSDMTVEGGIVQRMITLSWPFLDRVKMTGNWHIQPLRDRRGGRQGAKVTGLGLRGFTVHLSILDISILFGRHHTTRGRFNLFKFIQSSLKGG